MRIFLNLALLPLHVGKVKIDESWPHHHGLKLQEARYDKLIELLAQYLKPDNMVKFKKLKNLLKRQRRKYVLA